MMVASLLTELFLMRHFHWLVALILLLAAPAWADVLVGEWQIGDPHTGAVFTLELREDGSGSLADQPFRWKRVGEQLAIMAEGEEVLYDVEIREDVLVISGGDSGEAMEFRRAGERPQARDAKNADDAEPMPPPARRDNPLAKTPPRENPLAKKDPRDNPLARKAPRDNPLAKRRAIERDDEAMAEAPDVSNDGDAPAQDENSIVGVWTDGTGQIVFNEDGTCDYVGQKLRYTYDGETLALTGPGGTVQLKVRVKGDTLIASDGNEAQELRRVRQRRGGDDAQGRGDAPGVAAGVAGVYVAQESSVDPTNAMVITQYLILWPDGSVGWEKTEMGATRASVGERLERFSMFRNDPAAKGRTYGQWRSDGRNVEIAWNIWDNLRCRGQIDARGNLTVEHMGILDEGATLTYERQR
jgi:hypothetical protein